MKTFTIIYRQDPSSGPGDYLRATVVAEHANAAITKFCIENPTFEDVDDGTLDEDARDDLPESVEVICAIEGDHEIYWNYD